MNLFKRLSELRHQEPYRYARRLFIVVAGFTVLILGVALIFLPGPAILVIPAGLAILATEFIWARKILLRMKKTLGFNRKGNRNDKAQS